MGMEGHIKAIAGCFGALEGAGDLNYLLPHVAGLITLLTTGAT